MLLIILLINFFPNDYLLIDSKNLEANKEYVSISANNWAKTFNIALEYYSNKDYRKAIRFGKRAESLAEKNYGKRSSEFSKTSFLIAMSYMQLSKLLESSEYFKKVIYWGITIEDEEGRVFVSLDFFRLYKIELGESNRAREFFGQLLIEFPQLPNYLKAKIHSELLDLNSIERPEVAKNHAETAILLFSESKAKNPEHPRYKDFAYTVNDYARLQLYSFSRLDFAAKAFQDAREMLSNLSLDPFVADRIALNYADGAYSLFEVFDNKTAVELLHNFFMLSDSFAENDIPIEQQDHYNLLVSIYSNMSEHDKALQISDEHIELLEKAKLKMPNTVYTQLISRALYFKGKAYLEAGKLSQSEQSFKESISIISSLEESEASEPILANYFYLKYYAYGYDNITTTKVMTYTQLIDLYIKQEELEKALNQINDLREFFQANNDHESLLYDDFLISQMNFYRSINGYKNVFLVLNEITNNLEENVKHFSSYFKTLVNISFAKIESLFALSFISNDIEESIQKADSILKTVSDYYKEEVYPDYEAELNSHKANFYMYKSRLNSPAYLTHSQIDTILFYRNKALPQYKAASNKNGEFETRLEINKMNFYKDQEQVFINAYKQVLTTFSKDISATELAIAEADLAKLYFHNNEFDLALKTIDSAFERASNYYINSFFSLSEEDKLDLKFKLSILLDAYSTYLVYSGESNIIDDQLFRYLKKHQWLNSVTLDNLGMIRRLAKKSSDNNINRVYKEWEAQKENLSQAYLSNINSDILILEQVKANRLEEKLYNLLLNDDSIESLVPKVDWDTSLKINLNDNESAIQIIKYNNTITKVAETNYVAIIINNDQTLKLVPVKNSNQLESDYYSYYRSQIENQKLDTKSFDRFWGEIDNSIDRDNRIYFSGDGIYQLVNPLTLYNSKTSSYLLKELDLIQTENLMTAIEQGVDLEIKSINHVNLFGSPNYTLNSGSSFSSVDNYFAQLPGTEKEVESISELFKQKGISVSTFLFDDASEKNVKEISSPSILHIASHGYFNESELINEPQEVEIGAISFNREGSLSRKTDYILQNRMVQSGLIFTGANNFLNNQKKHLNEDGILTALEVSDLNLIDTDLVVLSACETGSGELVSGEGVFGLKRALSIAGVKSMIISLWEVDDQATNELMVSFYNNLLESNDLDRSLKESQLYLQSKYPHPYFWGSFILTNSK